MQLSGLMLVVLLFQSTIGIKVRDRLLRYKSGEARCIISIFRKIAPDDIPHEMWHSILKTMDYVIRDLNCTVIVDKGIHTKLPGPNETYDGYVGTIEKNEADACMYGIRPDSLPGEPGKVTPPLISGDIIIITSAHPPEILTYDLTKFLDLGQVSYIFIAAALLFMVPVIFVYAESRARLRNAHRNSIRLLKKHLACCEGVINLILDQEQFAPKTVAGRMLTLAMAIFTLVVIRCYVLNAVGADLVTIRSKPPVDTLRELLSSSLVPLVMNKLFAHNVFESSPEHSEQHELWLKIKDHLPNSTITLREGKNRYAPLDAAIEKVWAHEAAFLEVECIGFLARYASCLTDLPGRYGTGATGLHVSKENLSQGIITSLMSHKIHPYTERVLVTAMTAGLEAGLLDGFMRMLPFIVSKARPELGFSINSTTLSCLEGARKEENVPQPLDVHRMRQFLFAWQYIWCLAFITFTLECLSKPLNKGSRKRVKENVKVPVIIYRCPDRPKRGRLFVTHHK